MNLMQILIDNCWEVTPVIGYANDKDRKHNKVTILFWVIGGGKTLHINGWTNLCAWTEKAPTLQEAVSLALTKHTTKPKKRLTKRKS